MFLFVFGLVNDVAQDNKLATTVKHVAIEVSARHRATMLEDIITVYGKGSHAIVFTQTKRECDELAAGQAFKTLTSQVKGYAGDYFFGLCSASSFMLTFGVFGIAMCLMKVCRFLL